MSEPLEPDAVEPAGRTTWRPPSYPQKRRRVPVRFWVIGTLIALLVILTAGSNIRDWWAGRLHDLTGGNKAANFVIGFVVASLPLIGVAIGSLHARGHRRVIRMLVLGAAGFCLTYLLSPSAVRAFTDGNATKVFDHKAPGYLTGVVVGELVWLVAVVLAWWRLRRWRRSRFGAATRRRGPA